MRKDRRERIGNDLSEYQKWVDYDMKKYGKISDITKGKIRKAGLSIVKDQYGDYEVIADRPIKEGLSDREWKTFVTELTKGLIKKGYDKEEANDIAIVRAKNLDDSWRQRWQGDILAQVRQELRLTEGKDMMANESCHPRKNRKLKEAKERHIKDLSNRELVELRKEIVLGSLFTKDYENSFDIDASEVYGFFDGFLDDAQYKFKDAYGRYPEDINELYDFCDNDEDLIEYAYDIKW